MHAAQHHIENAALQQSSRNAAQAERSTAITELVLTRHSPDQAMVLLPMISHLTRTSNRWITWIVDQRVNKEELLAYGVDSRKLQIIYAPRGEESRWMIWEALNTGTSECVIGTPGSMSEQELEHMGSAAHQGNCRGLMISYK